MYAAYEGLSDRMKAYIEGLTAIHDGDHVYRPLFPDVDRRYPSSTHPIVRTHPVTKRKALFVNASYVIRIPEVPKEESDAILNYLYLHCTNPNFQVLPLEPAFGGLLGQPLHPTPGSVGLLSTAPLGLPCRRWRGTGRTELVEPDRGARRRVGADLGQET